MAPRRREAILNVYTLAFGLFLFVSPWLFGFARDTSRLNAWVSSVLLVTISIAALFRFDEWEGWIVLAIGLWLPLSPWLLGFLHTPAMRIDLTIGILVAYIAALELWLIHYLPSQSDAP
jgi:hypothetical protein